MPRNPRTQWTHRRKQTPQKLRQSTQRIPVRRPTTMSPMIHKSALQSTSVTWLKTCWEPSTSQRRTLWESGAFHRHMIKVVMCCLCRWANSGSSIATLRGIVSCSRSSTRLRSDCVTWRYRCVGIGTPTYLRHVSLQAGGVDRNAAQRGMAAQGDIFDTQTCARQVFHWTAKPTCRS